MISRSASLYAQMTAGLRGSQPLSELLPFAVRLAERSGDSDLASWARLEIGGYNKDNPAVEPGIETPPYRTVPGRFYDSFGRVLRVENPNMQFINEVRLPYGISTLERFNLMSETIFIQVETLNALIRKNLKVEVDRFGFSPSSIADVLAGIRLELGDRLENSRLLDAIRDEAESSASALPTERNESWVARHVIELLIGIAVTVIGGLILVWLGAG